MKKYITQENGSVMDTETGTSNIHPGLGLWAKYRRWLDEGNTPDPQYSDNELAEQNQAELDRLNREYLKDTDWMVIRSIERGVPVPVNVTAARLKAANDIGR